MTHHRTLPFPAESHGKHTVLSIYVKPPAVLFPTLDFEADIRDLFTHQFLEGFFTFLHLVVFHEATTPKKMYIILSRDGNIIKDQPYTL
jgi:hypothetical protein